MARDNPANEISAEAKRRGIPYWEVLRRFGWVRKMPMDGELRRQEDYMARCAARRAKIGGRAV